MELQEKDNIYQNNIAILSMSRVDEESGRRTMQFNPPSHMINSQHSITQNKKFLSIGLYNLVISALIVICLCVILAVVITTIDNARHNAKGPIASSLSSGHSNDSDIELEPITLNDVLLGNLTPDLFNGTWITDKKIAYYDEYNNLCSLDVSSLKKDIIISNQTILIKQLHGDSLSKNLEYLLTPYDTSKTFRHSTLSRYKIYDIKNDSFSYLLPHEESGEHEYIQFAEWGPTGTQIIFVHQNNIYYKSDVNAIPIQLTSTGQPNVIYNGYADWVYEEEILDDEKAFWVSPDGKHLVYATINDTDVETMSWPFYGEYYNLSSNQYPLEVAIRYPKPGRDNPSVNIFVLNLNNSVDNIEIVRLDPPNAIYKYEYYFTAVGWIDNDRVAITWLTRVQNYSVIDICDRNQMWFCNTTFTVESANSWIDLYEAPIPVPQNNSFLLRIPELINHESGYYRHVAVVNVTNQNVKFLTMGLFDVIEILAFNQKENIVYFMSTLQEKPEVRHLMSVSINDDKIMDPFCYTCNFGNSCLYNNIFMSPSTDYFVLQCDGPEIPRVEIRRTKNNSLISLFETNESLKSKLKKKIIPKTRKLRVKTSDHFYANVELVLPPNFDEKKKYPVLIEVYGGPGSQLVLDKYRTNHWSSHLASNLSIIYARIDGRGTDNRGVTYLHQIYKNMGNVEVMDVIAVARYFRNNVSFIKGDSIAIWGWSYGGYMALMASALDYLDPVFMCSIAVAPVTNWMYYDSVYVERYMGWPFDNIEEYNRSNLLNKVILLKNKKLLLAFGTADDNVHSQHSMLLMSKLNEFGILYETQVYPDNDHSLRGSTVHLYNRMNEFLERCFNI